MTFFLVRWFANFQKGVCPASYSHFVPAFEVAGDGAGADFAEAVDFREVGYLDDGFQGDVVKVFLADSRRQKFLADLRRQNYSLFAIRLIESFISEELKFMSNPSFLSESFK